MLVSFTAPHFGHDGSSTRRNLTKCARIVDVWRFLSKGQFWPATLFSCTHIFCCYVISQRKTTLNTCRKGANLICHTCNVYSPQLLSQLTCGTTKPKLSGMSILTLSVSLRETYLEQEKNHVEGGRTGDS